jgi:hypothetical protein
MRKTWIGAALGAAAALTAATAGAVTLDVTFVGAGYYAGDFVTWQQDSNPTPVAWNTDSSFGPVETDIAVTNVTGGSFTEVYYYGESNGGGFQTDDVAFDGFGPQLHTGTEQYPVFWGTYTVIYGEEIAGTITFAPVTAPAPEPSTWVLMLAGFAGIGALALRSRRSLAA